MKTIKDDFLKLLPIKNISFLSNFSKFFSKHLDLKLILSVLNKYEN